MTFRKIKSACVSSTECIISHFPINCNPLSQFFESLNTALSCVERFASFLLPKFRDAETSNMFRNKPTAGSVCGGICCSFPLLYLKYSQTRTKQNSIKTETLALLPFAPRRCVFHLSFLIVPLLGL